MIISTGQDRLTLLEAQLKSLSPQSKMESFHQYIDEFSVRMDQVMQNHLSHNQYKLDSLSQRLEGGSLQSVLKRGFSYFENLNGNSIDRAGNLKKNDLVKAVFQDGKREFKVND